MSDYCQVDPKAKLEHRSGLWIRPSIRQDDCKYKDDVEDWFQEEEHHGDLIIVDISSFSPAGFVVDPGEAHAGDSDLRRTFAELVSQWKDETWFISSIKKRIAHPAYLKIIGLGAPAVRLILEELRKEPDFWSYALEAITREDPIPQATTLRQLRDAWLAWGGAHGY